MHLHAATLPQVGRRHRGVLIRWQQLAVPCCGKIVRERACRRLGLKPPWRSPAIASPVPAAAATPHTPAGRTATALAGLQLPALLQAVLPRAATLLAGRPGHLTLPLQQAGTTSRQFHSRPVRTSQRTQSCPSPVAQETWRAACLADGVGRPGASVCVCARAPACVRVRVSFGGGGGRGLVGIF